MEQRVKYGKGDVVKIELQESWVEGFVEKVNEDSSYSVSIPEYVSLGLEQKIYIVKDNIRPLFLTKDVEFLLAEGYNREEVFQSLDAANGDLDDALLYLHRCDRLQQSEGESDKDSCHLQRSSEMSENITVEHSATNSTSQPSSTSSIKEFTPSQKQIEKASRTPSLGTPLMAVQSTAAYRKTSFFDDVQEKRKITMKPRADEFDYAVVFEQVPLGFEIHPCANNRNACVGKCLNEFSKENVYKGSLILDCNDVWLLGQSTVYIQQCIKAECQITPVTISFRAKKWMTSRRATNLRKRLEKARTKRAQSFTYRKRGSRQKLQHERAKTENFLSPHSCNINPSTKVIRVRLPPSQRRQLKKAVLNPELRLFISGGKAEFGITHVTASIKNMKTLSTKKYTTNRTPCFGESLIWEKFQQEAESAVIVKAMSQDKVVGTGVISIPILPCTIQHSLELINHNRMIVGKLNVNVTHIR